MNAKLNVEIKSKILNAAVSNSFLVYCNRNKNSNKVFQETFIAVVLSSLSRYELHDITNNCVDIMYVDVKNKSLASSKCQGAKLGASLGKRV